ncbi:MAG: hypothetical protein CVT67_10375 [Actinobacteria bacterium HGW-Actinobacteria-7]|nr:MAG: hypothetical protein CVT67_10375 [Actinobacteria bacterium HGW-Actinobacteria-7]
MLERRDNAFLVTLIALALSKAALTRWLIFGVDNPAVGVALELAAIVGVLCLVDAAPLKRRPLLTFAAYLGLIALMYANLLYASYFDQLADPSTLMVAGQVGSVLGVIVTLLHPIHLLYVLDLTFMAVWAIHLSDRTLEPAYRSGTVTAFGVLGVVAFGFQLAVVASFPSTVDGLALAQARGLGAYQMAALMGGEPAASASALSVLPDSSAAGSSDVNSPGAAVQRRVESLRQAQYGPRVGGVKRGEYADANVFVIQVESYQAFAQGTSIGDQQVTPNMNDFADQSWVFTNAFSQTGAGNTADAEFVANTSLMPPTKTPASVTYVDRELPALPRILSAAGYRAITMHANDASFWNRKELYASLGFDAYYDKKKFPSDDTIFRGASDEVFFSAAQRYLEAELSKGQPLYVNLVTMSSHAPFNGIPDDREPLRLPGDLKDCRAGQFLGAISYTDAAVGDFIAWLKASGQWDSSIVIIYGDHTAMKDLDLKGDNKRLVEELLGRPYSAVDRQRIAMMVHLPGQVQGEVNDSVVGQVDIAPTIADLLGEDISRVPHLGRSAFVDSDPLVITRSYFPAGSFIDNGMVFTPRMSFDDGSALDVRTGEETTPGFEERDLFDRAAGLSALSDEWIRSCPPRVNVGDIKDAEIPRFKTDSD